MRQQGSLILDGTPSITKSGAHRTGALARGSGHPVPVADFNIRLALANDVAAINEVFRRSSLSNEGDRVFLLDNPEVLVYY